MIRGYPTYAVCGLWATLAREKLAACHPYNVSVETLRQWMMADGFWVGKRRKPARIHQRRPRRPSLGELVQIDGGTQESEGA